MAMATRSLADLREEMRGVARGERQASPLPAAAVLQVLSSPENLDLLRIIHEQRPATVSALAALAGRAQPNVSRALQQLARHGLVRLQPEGREVRPVPTLARIDIDIAHGTYAAVPLPV
jgi:predicted transcriptional regulator